MSRRMSSSAARTSGEIFLFAILIVLSEKLVELLLDSHDRQDDSPDVVVAQSALRNRFMLHPRRLSNKWPITTWSSGTLRGGRRHERVAHDTQHPLARAL